MPLGLPLNEMYTRTPLVFAHRGASFNAPANTLAAFRAAREMGADGVELDTSLTADDVPVVIHDMSVDETTDGTGRVRDLTLRELKRLDAGSYFDFSFRSERIPTLEEAFEAIGPDMLVNVELKALKLRSFGLEDAVFSIIRKAGFARRVIVSSFNPFTLRRMHRIAPEMPLGFLHAPDVPAYLRLVMVGVPHQARHPHQAMIDAKYMSWAHQRAYRVNTWTVDDPMRVAALRDLGVDGIITNRPDVMLAALGRSNAHSRAH